MSRCTTLTATAAVLFLHVFAGSATAATIAYVETGGAANHDLNKLIRVERNKKPIPLKGGSVDLDVGDQIFLLVPNAVVRVRYIATNTVVPVIWTANSGHGGRADLTVVDSSVDGLAGGLLNWLKSELSGADQRSHHAVLAASRSVSNSATCYNETGESNNPVSFDVPILGAAKAQLVKGTKSLFVSWKGGAAPFKVVLSETETGRIVAQSGEIRGQCNTRLNPVALSVGRYRLTIKDTNSVSMVEDSIFVVDKAPEMPEPLRNATLSEEARNIYFATWLAATEGGIWALEAQQRVAGMPCQSQAVQQWLRRWGDVPVCQN